MPVAKPERRSAAGEDQLGQQRPSQPQPGRSCRQVHPAGHLVMADQIQLISNPAGTAQPRTGPATGPAGHRPGLPATRAASPAVALVIAASAAVITATTCAAVAPGAF